MKYRSCFVSNSSSSNFVCQVCLECGEQENDGYGIGSFWWETYKGMVCRDHFFAYLVHAGLEEKFEQEMEKRKYNQWYDISWLTMEDAKEFCPFYNRYYFTDKHLLDYALSCADFTKPALIESLGKAYSSYEEMEKALGRAKKPESCN